MLRFITSTYRIIFLWVPPENRSSYGMIKRFTKCVISCLANGRSSPDVVLLCTYQSEFCTTGKAAGWRELLLTWTRKRSVRHRLSWFVMNRQRWNVLFFRGVISRDITTPYYNWFRANKGFANETTRRRLAAFCLVNNCVLRNEMNSKSCSNFLPNTWSVQSKCTQSSLSNAKHNVLDFLSTGKNNFSH